MTLRVRTLLTSTAVAIPAGLVLFLAVERLRASDLTAAVERFADAQMSELMREACETDPKWFLAGPREGRPSLDQRNIPDADVYLPRPAADELPFEFFAYDDAFVASSPAGPRFPVAFRNAMRGTPPERAMTGPFETPEGSGVQTARLTGWSPGPCAVLLVRSRPVPRARVKQAVLLAGLTGVAFLGAWLAVTPTAARIRRLSEAARESARQDYAPMPPLRGRDELSAVGFVYGEAAADVRRRDVEIRDREEALRRYAAATTGGIARPLEALGADLGELDETLALPEPAREEVRRAGRELHTLGLRLGNLAAAATLRMRAGGGDPPAAVDVGALVERVVARHRPFARGVGVSLRSSPPDEPVTLAGDAALLEQAVANVVDNAVRYNRAGGAVEVAIDRRAGGFALRVTDSGPGVSDDVLQALGAIGRFRGDEDRRHKPGGRGLGLAISREVADRHGLDLEIRRAASGGLEVVFATKS